MDGLVKKYPDYVSTEIFGKTTEGRVMRAIKISAAGPDSSNSNRPVVWLDGGIHGQLFVIFAQKSQKCCKTLLIFYKFLAREWVAVSTVTYIANQVIKRAINEDFTDLVNTVDWIIVPVMNPDGYEYTFTKDRNWRKTRSRNFNSSCRGVGK
jgi:extracellular matrix protein 14